MDAYNKKRLDDFRRMPLIVYWWNLGKKTLDFEGTVEEYLNQYKVKYSVKVVPTDSQTSLERIQFKAKMSVGSMNFSFDGYNLEDLIRMALNIRLSYLGDKSMYLLEGRTRTINFIK